MWNSLPAMVRIIQSCHVLVLVAAAAQGLAPQKEGTSRYDQNSQMFSYDPAAEFGPSRWGDLDIPDNQCNGSKNSPIDIKSTPCTILDSYSFQVSSIS